MFLHQQSFSKVAKHFDSNTTVSKNLLSDCTCDGLPGPTSYFGELKKLWWGGGPRGPPQQRSVWLQGQITQTHRLQGQQQLWIESDYEQCLYVENLEAVWDKSCLYQAPEYSGGLGKGVAYRPPYSQDESTDEGHYERPQHMRSYTSAVMQPMLPAQVEYAQYVHPVDEVLLQHLERAGQPVPATTAFLWDDLAVMVVEGLLNQIKLMRRQRVSTLEQIEHVGKRKAPAFKELMVEPKRARAPSQHPQKLAWAPACTVAWLPLQPLKLASGASTLRSIHTDPAAVHRVQEPDIPAEPLAELSLEASDPIMSDAPAVQQEQRSKVPQAPVASSSKAGASSQGGARVVPELPVPHVQPAVVESHRLSVSVPALDVPGPSKHC
ncbi:hypothetical protein C0995_011099 [Termitomyces sp. Mi166|nr:hypothetical protein C0995_011099 [Termitomyces sp. Mi166\